jgi:hypothetical protein
MKNLFKSAKKQKMNIEDLKSMSQKVEDSKLLNSIVGGLAAAQGACHPGSPKSDFQSISSLI